MVANRCPRAAAAALGCMKKFFAAPTCLSYSPPSLSWSSISRPQKRSDSRCRCRCTRADEMSGCEKNDKDPWPQNQREPFRNALNEITATQKIRVSELVSIIEFNGERRHANLSSAIGCLFSITIAASSRPIGPSMTLGNMREL